MRLVNILQIVVLIFLLASAWLLRSGYEILALLIESEEDTSKVIGDFLSDENKQTSVGHLLAVLERFKGASQTLTESIVSVQSLVSNVEGMILGLVVVQLVIIALTLQHNQRH